MDHLRELSIDGNIILKWVLNIIGGFTKSKIYCNMKLAGNF